MLGESPVPDAWSIGVIVSCATEAVRKCLPDAQGRTGGVLMVFNRHLSREYPVLVAQIGRIPLEKIGEKHGFAREKAQRLMEHPTHVSSFQSADESQGRYGGAIALKDLCLSFSGFPPQVDEAVVLDTALESKLCDDIDVTVITHASGNEYARRKLIR